MECHTLIRPLFGLRRIASSFLLAKGSVLGRMPTQLLRHLLGGWTFDGITTLQSGLALAPTDSDSSTLNADFSQRPNRVPERSLLPKRKEPSSLAQSCSVCDTSSLLRMGECKSGKHARASLLRPRLGVGQDVRF